MSYIFTSESVSEGHPDKVADQISDAVLDAYLTQDPQAKVACEVLITSGLCVIAGEVTSVANVDAEAIARAVLHRIGYDNDDVGFNLHRAEFRNALHRQSPEIHASVVHGGAGDQGIMFGHACNETPEGMPLPIHLAHRIMRELQTLRHAHTFPWLRPDAKSQVSVEYDGHTPVGVSTIVISTQHAPDITQAQIREALLESIVVPLAAEYNRGRLPEVLINPSGSFVTGGPHGDTGLTGRKIIVDTYGGRCPHGGGAFSGKDATKVDRSAAYAARWVAQHLVATGLTDRCTVQLAYAIGVDQPVSVHVDAGLDPVRACEVILAHFDLSPRGILNALNLDQPIFSSTSVLGHFGKPALPWEVLDDDRVASLRSALG